MLLGRGSYEVKNNSLRAQSVCLCCNCTGWEKGAEGMKAVTALQSVCASVLCVALCYTGSRPVDSSTTLLAE